MRKILKCIDCGGKIKNYKAKRCWNCYVKYSQIPKNNPNWKEGIFTTLYYCTDCGKPISVSSGAYRTGKCHSCGIKGEKNHFFGVRLSGILSPTFIDGRSYLPYTLDFTLELREQIRKRDGYTCQNPECNMTEEEHLTLFGQVLHAHHIDYNKQNCKKNNLITLCLSCNVRANSNRDYWQKFYTKKIGEKNLFPTKNNVEDNVLSQKEISSPSLLN